VLSHPVLIVVVLAIAVMLLGWGRSRAARRVSRAIAFVGFAAFGLVCAASLYGMVALGDRGGGVLLFLALPTGFVAWLFLTAFTTSREVEAMEALPIDERMARTNALLAVQLAEHERTIAEGEAKLGSFWITPGKRRRLREEVAHARLMLRGLRRMQPALEDPRSYDGPTGDRGD